MIPRNTSFGDPLLDDFRNFFHHALLRTKGVKPTRLQYDIADWIWRGPEFRMAMALRGVGKSLIMYIYMTWLLRRDWAYSEGRPSANLMVAAGTADLADNGCGFMQDLIVIDPLLSCMVPKVPRRWSRLAFDVEGAIPQVAPNMFSKGVFGRLTGDRADVIGFDDIEIPQNSETQGQREKLRRRAAEFVDLLKPEGGEMVCLGTPQCEDSIYDLLPEWGFEIRCWPAEYPTQVWMEHNEARLAPLLKKDMDEGDATTGDPTEPTRFNYQELDKRKASGLSRYALQYMLDTSLSDAGRYPLRLSDLIVMDLDPELGPVRPVWASGIQQRLQDLPCVGLRGDAFYGPMTVVDNHFSPYDQIIACVDPSGRGADETAWFVLGVLGGLVCVLSMGFSREGYDDAVLEKMVDDFCRFRVPQVVVEQNFGDGMFEVLLQRKIMERVEQEKAKRKPLDTKEPWKGAGVEGVKHTTNKEARIIDALEPVMNQHRLVVSTIVVHQDQPGEGDTGESRRLFHQMTRLQRIKGALTHDDRLDALATGVRFLVDRMAIDQEHHNHRVREEEEDRKWRDYFEHQKRIGSPLWPKKKLVVATGSKIWKHSGARGRRRF